MGLYKRRFLAGKGLHMSFVASRMLIEAGLGACATRLIALGFKRHAHSIFTMPLTPDVWGWVARGSATHLGDGMMEITPFVGLLCPEVERLSSKLRSLPYHRYSPATVQMNVGTLLPPPPEIPGLFQPREIHVTFQPDSDVEAPAERVCAPIRDVGVPWMREHASLEAVYALTVANNVAFRNYRLPILAWLMGDLDQARAHLREEYGALYTKSIAPSAPASLEPAVQTYQRFVTAFEAHVSASA